MCYLVSRKRSIALPLIFIILSSIGWQFSCSKKDMKQTLLASWRSNQIIPGNLIITHPLSGALFPPEIAAPTIAWQDKSSEIKNWCIFIHVNPNEEIVSDLAEVQQWQPNPEQWEQIKFHGRENDVAITVLGFRDEKILSGAQAIIRISSDSVNAPIFYRAVPLPFIYATKHLNEIRWHLGDISSPNQPPALLENLPLCGNCHSFTPDGATVAMDVDYANDKGSYAIAEIRKETILTADNIITWSDYSRADDEKTFGLLSQISPDGRYVVSTVKDRSIFVATEGFEYSQLFFPIKGILAIYDRETQKYQSLPGANDPAYVQSSPCWSPDGRYIYFARGPVYHLPKAEKVNDIILPTSMAKEFIERKREFKYDIYRLPFNNGKGGQAAPVPGASNNGMSNFFPRISPDGKWLVFTQAANFMLLQPDSKLFIMPAEGGQPREMICNTSNMNSWHSWSPNSRWLVFASKFRRPYSELLLTHIDENGKDTPPVLLEKFSFIDRTCNIPEFVNIKPENWTKIVDHFSNQSHYYVTLGRQFMGDNKNTEAAQALLKAIELDSTNIDAYVFQGHLAYNLENYDSAIRSYNKAIALNARDIELYINKGAAQYKAKDYHGSIESFNRAIKLDSKNPYSYFARGSSKAKLGKLQSAIADYNKSIELGYQLDKVYYERGLSHALLKKYKEASVDFELTTKINPSNVSALEKLGNCYYQLKRYNDAAITYSKALNINPQAKEIYTYRGLCKIALNDIQGAIDEYDEAIRIDPNFAMAYCQRGVLMHRLGNNEAGCKDLYRAKELGFKEAEDVIRKYCAN